MGAEYLIMKYGRGGWHGLFDGQIDEAIDQFIRENAEHLAENYNRFHASREPVDDYLNHLRQMAKYGTRERKERAIELLLELYGES